MANNNCRTFIPGRWLARLPDIFTELWRLRTDNQKQQSHLMLMGSLCVKTPLEKHQVWLLTHSNCACAYSFPGCSACAESSTKARL